MCTFLDYFAEACTNNGFDFRKDIRVLH
jgi:hypothetical protein